MTLPIICFGEALIDFLHIGSNDHDGIAHNTFTQFPGGAPANAAVAISKLGGKSQFIGQVGKDAFGDFLLDTLNHYGVNTQYTFQHNSAKTALAFVFLDKQGERSFSFYRENSADVLFTSDQVNEQLFSKQQIFHFCSNTLTTKNIASSTLDLINKAIEKRAIISFDVNLRHNLWPKNTIDTKQINTLILKSDIVKYSKEEFDVLADEQDKYIERCFDSGVKLLLITDGGAPVTYFTRTLSGSLPIPDVDVVDTTAGGDAFTGGLLHAINQSNLTNLLSDQTQLEHLISFAVQCGAIAVSRKGAFPSLPTKQDIKLSGLLTHE